MYGTRHQIQLFAVPVAGILAVALLVAGCTRTEGETATSRGFDSPQAAFEGLQAAVSDSDWHGFASLLTDESQNELAGVLLFMSGMIAAFDQQGTDEIEAIYERYVKDDVDLHGDDMEMSGMDDLAKLGEQVEDKPAFITEVINWMSEVAPEFPDELATISQAKLENLEERGAEASGEIVMPNEVGDRQPIEFRRVDGRWFVHLPMDQ